MSDNSHRSQHTGLNSFRTFMASINCTHCWPAKEVDIIRFISYLSLEGKRFNTIKSYVSALAIHHKINGWPDPTKSFVISKLLEGCKRDKHVKDIRHPLNPDELSLILQTLKLVCTDDYETLLFSTAMMAAYFAMLRLSEFAFSNRHKDSVITHKSVTLIPPNTVKIFIPKSKTDQHARGVTLEIKSSHVTSPSFYPTLSHYKKHRPHVSGPFFIHKSGSPLTESQFTGVLKKVIAACNLDNLHITSHSFRIGHATYCKSVLGMTNEHIMKIGRWTSGAYRSYIRCY